MVSVDRIRRPLPYALLPYGSLQQIQPLEIAGRDFSVAERPHETETELLKLTVSKIGFPRVAIWVKCKMTVIYELRVYFLLAHVGVSLDVM